MKIVRAVKRLLYNRPMRDCLWPICDRLLARQPPSFSLGSVNAVVDSVGELGFSFRAICRGSALPPGVRSAHRTDGPSVGACVATYRDLGFLTCVPDATFSRRQFPYGLWSGVFNRIGPTASPHERCDDQGVLRPAVMASTVPVDRVGQRRSLARRPGGYGCCTPARQR